MGNNTSGHYKRVGLVSFNVKAQELIALNYYQAISSAMMVGFGNAGGLVASNVFLASEAPYYHTGYGTALGLMWVCALACTGFLVGVHFENRKRDRGGRDYRFKEPDSDNLGDDHPHFRFTY